MQRWVAFESSVFQRATTERRHGDRVNRRLCLLTACDSGSGVVNNSRGFGVLQFLRVGFLYSCIVVFFGRNPEVLIDSARFARHRRKSLLFGNESFVSVPAGESRCGLSAGRLSLTRSISVSSRGQAYKNISVTTHTPPYSCQYSWSYSCDTLENLLSEGHLRC